MLEMHGVGGVGKAHAAGKVVNGLFRAYMRD